MTRTALLLAALGLTATAHAQWHYPPAKTVDAKDIHFGKTYPDPYRWLEETKDKAVEAWFKSQAELTESLLGKIPGRDALAAEWMALDKLKPATYSAIQYEAGRVFYKKVLGGENVGKLFYREGWKGAETLLFDPATYKPGVVSTINAVLPSWNGKYLVLGFSSGGAEYSELRVLEVDKRALLPEKFYPSYGPLSWLPDSKTFLYDAGKQSDIKALDVELNRKTRIHTIGSEFTADADFFSNESYPELGIAPKEFPMVYLDEANPAWLLGSVATVESDMKIFYAPSAGMKNKKLTWSVLAKPSDKLVRGFVVYKDQAYAVTHAGASRYKVVRSSLTKPDWGHAETVIPEASDSIQTILRSSKYLFVVYSNGISGRLVKFDLATNKSAEVKLPSGGIVDVHCPDFQSDRCFVFLTSWTSPPTIWDYDATKDHFAKSVFNTDAKYPGFENLIAEEVEVPGHDGTMIPLSIIRRKDLKLDGKNPTILEGYGAYGISYSPHFNPRISVALRGVVIAFAHVRGGSEKGEAWYKAGFKKTKPNTWKDFIAAGEYLVKKGYTSPQHLAGTGTSAGGILISRAITERPDLFGAAVCNVGVANALRMEFSPNGPINTPEFGTVKIEDEAAALAEMDGVSHVKKGVKYPAVLGVGGWNDPRVTVWQQGKLVAALQASNASAKPILMKVNYDNGHFTEEKLVTFKNFASQYAFMLWQTGHKDFVPTK